QAGEQYGLVDEVTGLVPDGVEADRSGDDLILRKKEDDTEIRIEGFWEECQPGETQCTAVFNVVGENGQVTEAVLTQDGPVLENFTAGQSGTLAEGISNGIIWGGIAFGAGLAAIALAAGGGGGSSRHKRTAEEDGNGKPDDQDAALKQAQDLVAAAEGKQTEAENALTEANKDGAINQTEHDDLTGKNQAVTEAKTPAQAAVDALPDGQEKSELQNRLDAVDGITVPAVNDQDGNGKPDDQDQQEAFNNARARLEKALNTVYQPNDDLYASYVLGFGKPTGNPEASTATWREVLNQNGVSGFSVDYSHSGEFRYIYNGVEGSDIISTSYSIGGTARTMINRNDMFIKTNGGDDIIAVGMDLGRSYSVGYTEKQYLTSMGDGDDILIVGLGNNDVGIHLKDDASLRISDRNELISDGELLFQSNSYDHGRGGIISSTSITMDDGDDTLLALGYEGFGKAIVNTDIDLGAGNDTIHVNGDVEAVSIKGGSGMDILAISHGTLSTKDFSGFEVIDLGDNNGGVNITASDLVKSGVDAIEGGTLKIIGSSNSKVNLDGDDWKSDGVQSEDGVNYNVYTHEAAPDIKILIDEHIANVM
uniref:GA-like domain-containing protein n=1 Tax=Escherichia coli TaxID=562 RepID=UPI001FCEB2A8